MKNTVRLVLAGLFVSLGGWQAALGQQPADAVSLLPNGDFANADAAGDWPEGWGVRTPGNGVTWETEKGLHFLRLVSQKPGQMQALYRSVKVSPGRLQAMKVTVRYRAVGVQPGKLPGEDALARVAFEDAQGRTLDSQAPPLRFAPAANWTEVSAPMLVPPAATRWILVAGFLHAEAGTLDLGEIKVQPLGAGEVSALATEEPNHGPPEASWVQNGDLSKPDPAGDWPADWGRPNPGMSWQTEKETHFVRMTVQNPGQTLMLNKSVPLKPGVRGIELLVRWRADGVEHGEHEWFDARTIVHFASAEGQQLPAKGGDIVFTHKPAPTSWKETVRSYPVPEGAASLQLMAGLFKAKGGTVDLAEVRVTAMKDAATELQRITSEAYGIWKGNEDQAQDRKVGAQIDALFAKTGDFVPNNQFKEIDKEGGPADWSKQLKDGVEWQEEKGMRFMHLTSKDEEKVRMLYRMIPLKLGLKEIEVTVRYRTAGITKGSHSPSDARVVMHFFNGLRWGHLENGKELEPQPADIELSSEAKDWTEVKKRFPVPEGTTKLQFMPGLWNVPPGGVLDLAELHVKPVADQASAATPTR